MAARPNFTAFLLDLSSFGRIFELKKIIAGY
jgi:hypothetical protein